MKDDVTVAIATKTTAQINAFASAEWSMVNILHHGTSHSLEKRRYRFIAKEKTHVVGLLDLIIKANVAYIDGILVGVEYRKHGIGRKLVLFAEDFARRTNVTKVWLDTEEHWNAVGFYKKLGYVITGAHENHYFGRRSLIMTKYLSSSVCAHLDEDRSRASNRYPAAA